MISHSHRAILEQTRLLKTYPEKNDFPWSHQAYSISLLKWSRSSRLRYIPRHITLIARSTQLIQWLALLRTAPSSIVDNIAEHHGGDRPRRQNNDAIRCAHHDRILPCGNRYWPASFRGWRPSLSLWGSYKSKNTALPRALEGGLAALTSGSALIRTSVDASRYSVRKW